MPNWLANREVLLRLLPAGDQIGKATSSGERYQHSVGVDFGARSRGGLSMIYDEDSMGGTIERFRHTRLRPDTTAREYSSQL